MGYINFQSDLFIGEQELNRFQYLLQDRGYKELFLKNSISFGLFHNNIADGNWSNFRIEQGTNAGTIKNSEGFAVDKNGNVMYRAANDNILLPDTNTYYWIKIAHQFDTRELGLVSIEADGDLTGVGTEFSKVLRGQPNNPVKISFPDSSTNTQEYKVIEVISDTQAVLAGNFSAQQNLRYAVVGAFTPDIAVPQDDKYPYQYSGCIMSLVPEVTPNTAPATVAGLEFLVARVKRNASAITIEDKRSLNIYKSKDSFQLSTIDTEFNPLIGVDSIQWDDESSTRANNLVNISWGFKATSWTIDSSVNRVTLIAGSGGKFKSTTDFTDGDFNGWRVYVQSGKYYIVKQSTITATQISCILDTLDPNEFTNTSQMLIVVPNVEGIELTFTATAGTNKPTQTLYYPISTGEAKVPLLAYQASAPYLVRYRYKNFWTYSLLTEVGEDDAGYYDESSFLENGNLKPLLADRTQVPYNDTITLTQAVNAYENRMASVETGDRYGVEYIPINTASDPIIVFEVGTRRQHVVITNDDDLDQSDTDYGTQYQLTTHAYLDLRTDTPSTLRNGNSFLIQFRGDYDLNGFTINITQDFVNSGNPGIILHTLTAGDIQAAKTDNLVYRATFDGTRWFLQKVGSNAKGALYCTIDGGGLAITTGIKGRITIPYNCTITGWTVLADVTGSVVLDVWKDSYSASPPTNADTITGADKPTLSSALKNRNLAVSAWTTNLLEGDVLFVNVDSASIVGNVTLTIHFNK